MDQQPQKTQNPPPRDPPPDSRSGSQPCPTPTPPPRSTLNIGPALVVTLRHFFPELNSWLDDFPDRRHQDFITYDKRFLLWWGLALFLFKLGSRRQLDFQLNTDGPEVLNNFNRLANTEQTTRPVNQTLDHYLQGVGLAAIAALRRQMVQRLIRMKALDAARLQGCFVVLWDATTVYCFHERHCEHCQERTSHGTTVYMHQVLEAKLLGPAHMVISLASEWIDARDEADTPAGASAEQRKQDCELKASARIVEQIRKEHPQLPLCFSGDSLFGCGTGFQRAKDAKAKFISVLKPGRMPSVWTDFQALLPLVPDQRVELRTPQGVTKIYRWVNDLSYGDSYGRKWKLTALQCEEWKDGRQIGFWAWVTDLEVNRDTVIEVADKGGRERWREENEGFNTQKNSDLNLEHAYSKKAHWAVYYLLLQIAHLILQLLEKGSVLREFAESLGKRTAVELFGSLKNMAYRLLESVRHVLWPSAEESARGPRRQIRFDTS